MSVRCGMQAEQTLRLKAQADLTEANTAASCQQATIEGLQHRVGVTRVEVERAAGVLADTKTELEQALNDLQVRLSTL